MSSLGKANPLIVEVDGEIRTGLCERVGGKVWIYFEGRTWVADENVPSSRGSKHKGANAPLGSTSEIVAPMPGKITKIEVAPGDAIDANSVAVVMEAMKMEYTLKAKTKGKIRAVHCKIGDQVVLGQKLVSLE